MEKSISVKFCPVCKRSNKIDTLICDFCGTLLVDLHLKDDSTKQVTDRRVTNTLNETSKLNSAFEGMAFFLYGKTEPFAVLSINQKEDLIYFGRVEDETNDMFVDLGLVNGFEMGVSRKHAMIRRQENRVEIMDLKSTNGTFLDGNRIQAEKFYELRSGATIQLGRLKIITIFSWYPNR